ncbi:MAG: hypothetical protein QXT63_07970 [Thermoplasmata archaeon]
MVENEGYDYEILTKDFYLKLKNTPESIAELGRILYAIRPVETKRGRGRPKGTFKIITGDRPKRPYIKSGKYSKKEKTENEQTNSVEVTNEK